MTEVVIAPPPTGQLRLPGGSRLPAGLPAIEPDFPDFLPLRTRLLRPPEPSAEETAGPAGPSLPADSRLTGGFTLKNPPHQKSSLPSGASLRLPIAERSGEPTAGAKGYVSSPRAGDLRRYLYGGMMGTEGASGGFFPGGESGKIRARGRASLPSSIRRYDLTPWARSVVELVQKNWLTPPAASTEKDLRVEIAVTVLKSGTLAAFITVSSSDDRLFDQSAKDAIEESLPFPPLPADFPESSVEISFVFTRQ